MSGWLLTRVAGSHNSSKMNSASLLKTASTGRTWANWSRSRHHTFRRGGGFMAGYGSNRALERLFLPAGRQVLFELDVLERQALARSHFPRPFSHPVNPFFQR